MSHTNTRSIELVRRAQSGDTESLNRLVTRYQDRVLKIVRLRLGAKLRRRVDSTDMTQETFVTAVRLIGNFEMRDEGSLIHWLARIAERQIKTTADHHSAEKRSMDRTVPLVAEPNGCVAGNGSQNGPGSAVPSDELQRRERQELVEACLAELSEEDRELIILRQYAGASWEFIAEQTGRPTPAAARMKYARALVELGIVLRNAGWHEDE